MGSFSIRFPEIKQAQRGEDWYVLCSNNAIQKTTIFVRWDYSSPQTPQLNDRPQTTEADGFSNVVTSSVLPPAAKDPCGSNTPRSYLADARMKEKREKVSSPKMTSEVSSHFWMV